MSMSSQQVTEGVANNPNCSIFHLFDIEAYGTCDVSRVILDEDGKVDPSVGSRPLKRHATNVLMNDQSNSAISKGRFPDVDKDTRRLACLVCMGRLAESEVVKQPITTDPIVPHDVCHFIESVDGRRAFSGPSHLPQPLLPSMQPPLFLNPDPAAAPDAPCATAAPPELATVSLEPAIIDRTGSQATDGLIEEAINHGADAIKTLQPTKAATTLSDVLTMPAGGATTTTTSAQPSSNTADEAPPAEAAVPNPASATPAPDKSTASAATTADPTQDGSAASHLVPGAEPRLPSTTGPESGGAEKESSTTSTHVASGSAKVETAATDTTPTTAPPNTASTTAPAHPARMSMPNAASASSATSRTPARVPVPVPEPVQDNVTMNRVEYPDGSIYEGQTVPINSAGLTTDGPSNTKRQGWGRFQWPNGNTYVGPFKDDQMHGPDAVLTQVEVMKHEGSFTLGKMNGLGRLLIETGVYTGQFHTGSLNGFGRFVYNDGAVYTGWFMEGQRHGHGRLHKPSTGDAYNGMWAHDSVQGFGRLIAANGNQYIGRFVNGRREGIGRFKWQKRNSVYEGGWQSDLMHGFGTYLSGEGDMYVGFWVQGRWTGRAGTCRLITRDGDVYDGDIDKHALTGRARHVWGSGRVYIGDMADGAADGPGVMRMASGDLFIGRFSGGLECGRGLFLNKLLQWYYYGEFEDGRRQGYGVQCRREKVPLNLVKRWHKSPRDVHPNPEAGGAGAEEAGQERLLQLVCEYRGWWADDRRHGQGNLRFLNGDTYHGNWCQDKMTGHGTYQGADAKYLYEGEWLEGLWHGYGVFVDGQYQHLEGWWRHGQLVDCAVMRNLVPEGDCGEVLVKRRMVRNKDSNQCNEMISLRGSMTLQFGDFFVGDVSEDGSMGRGRLLVRQVGIGKGPMVNKGSLAQIAAQIGADRRSRKIAGGKHHASRSPSKKRMFLGVPTDPGRYLGPFIAGYMHGRGRFEWPDGSLFIGHLNRSVRKGAGYMRWGTGWVMIGELVDTYANTWRASNGENDGGRQKRSRVNSEGQEGSPGTAQGTGVAETPMPICVCAGEFLGKWDGPLRHIGGKWRELRVLYQKKGDGDVNRYTSIRSLAMYMGSWFGDRLHKHGRLMLRSFHPRPETDPPPSQFQERVRGFAGLQHSGIEEVALYTGPFNHGVPYGRCTFHRWRRIHETPTAPGTSTNQSESKDVFGEDGDLKWLDPKVNLDEVWKRQGFSKEASHHGDWEQLDATNRDMFRRAHVLFADVVGETDAKIQAIFGQQAPVRYTLSQIEDSYVEKVLTGDKKKPSSKPGVAEPQSQIPPVPESEPRYEPEAPGSEPETPQPELQPQQSEEETQ